MSHVDEGTVTGVVAEEMTGAPAVETVGVTFVMIEIATMTGAEEMTSEEDGIIVEVPPADTVVDPQVGTVAAADLGLGVLHQDVTMIETGDVTTAHLEDTMIVTTGVAMMITGMVVVEEDGVPIEMVVEVVDETIVAMEGTKFVARNSSFFGEKMAPFQGTCYRCLYHADNCDTT